MRKAKSPLQNNALPTVVRVVTTSTSDSSSCLPPNELWDIKIEQISSKLASNGDTIMPEDLEVSLEELEL
jgi:hypothetical protein